MSIPLQQLEAFLGTVDDLVRIELTRVRGSSPRERGAVMFTSADAYIGTIGGGQLEYMAIDEARALLRRGDAAGLMDVPLGPEIGQCCGGRVEISLTVMNSKERKASLDRAKREFAARPSVLIIGAGHVGRALASVLTIMPVRPVLIDSRTVELDLCGEIIEKRLTPLPEDDVRNAAPGSAVIILTHDHSLDFLVAAEALRRSDLSYIGMIGSKTKRASFEKWAAANSEPKVEASRLVCPMGESRSRDKRPEVIAAFIAAEVMSALSEATVVAGELADSVNGEG